MGKTRQEWNDLSEWTSDRMLSRVKFLRGKVEGIYAANIDSSPNENDALGDYCDEAVYILLSILKKVIKEKQWKDVTPLELFEGVYCEMSGWAWSAVLQRFVDTKDLVKQYQSNDSGTRSMVKQKLVSRGLI